MENSDHYQDNPELKEKIAAEIVHQVESLFFDLHASGTGIYRAIEEIEKNVGNLRLAFHFCDEIQNNLKQIKLHKRDKTGLRKILGILKLMLNETHMNIHDSISRLKNSGTAFKILERIEASRREMIMNPNTHSWIYSINTCLNTPKEAGGDFMLEGLKSNFSSLVSQIAKGSQPAEKDFEKFNHYLSVQQMALRSVANYLALYFKNAAARANCENDNTFTYLLSKITDIQEYIGGYFSVTREPAKNIPENYRQITNRTEGFVKSMLDHLTAIGTLKKHD